MESYRLPTHGAVILNDLTDRSDNVMVAYQCENVIIIGDLNNHIVRDTFNTLVVVHVLKAISHFPSKVPASHLTK